MPCYHFKVDKLVRDFIPSILREQGTAFHERILEQDEFISRLKDKLLEEAEEVKAAQTSDELTEELADLLEVIQTLSKASGITMQQIEKERLKKLKARGGFDKKICTSLLDLHESHEKISHKSDCLFCQIPRQEVEREILAKFPYCYVIKDAFPVSNGHILIIPNEHTENWFTASEEVRLDMIKALTIMKGRLDSEYKPHGYNIGLNVGEVAGQSVMHLHMQVIPRYLGDVENPRGGVRGVIPSKQNY